MVNSRSRCLQQRYCMCTTKRREPGQKRQGLEGNNEPEKLERGFILSSRDGNGQDGRAS